MNSGGGPMDLWKDALAQAKTQASQWPFDWVPIPSARCAKGYSHFATALCTGRVPKLYVEVNGQSAGEVARLNATGDSSIVRHNIQGVWLEREIPFDAALMKQGKNIITLTIPSGSLNSGVIYDCVRLELDENKPWR
jgi:rhamnogalacturonan endolyase